MDPGWGTRTASTFMEFCYNLISSLGSETLLWVLGNTQNQFEHHKYWPALWLSNLGSTSAFQKVLSMDLDKWQICPIKCLRTTLKWIRRDRLNPMSIYKQPAFENGKAYRAGRRTSDLSPFYSQSHEWPCWSLWLVWTSIFSSIKWAHLILCFQTPDCIFLLQCLLSWSNSYFKTKALVPKGDASLESSVFNGRKLLIFFFFWQMEIALFSTVNTIHARWGSKSGGEHRE